jgi:hypothetical protein
MPPRHLIVCTICGTMYLMRYSVKTEESTGLGGGLYEIRSKISGMRIARVT